MQVAATTKLGVMLIGASLATVICRLTDTHVAPPAPRELSTAVLPDGFAYMDGAPSDRHVVALDLDGQRAYRRAIPVTAQHARMVGTAGGIAVGWQDGSKVKLARVTGDGHLGEVSSWGKRVTQLCDGTASNEERWGIGWLENDGALWVVFGPVGSSSAEASAMAATKVVWCGVTSAGKDIALMSRDDKGRMELYRCDRKKCGTLPQRVPIKPKWLLEGIACNDEACLIAHGDDNGDANLTWMNKRGKAEWTQRLPDAAKRSRFSVVAAGDKAFAVGYVTGEGAVALRVIQGGSRVRAWADPSSTEAPVLAWAKDRLLVAHRHNNEVAPEVVALPR